MAEPVLRFTLTVCICPFSQSNYKRERKRGGWCGCRRCRSHSGEIRIWSSRSNAQPRTLLGGTLGKARRTSSALVSKADVDRNAVPIVQVMPLDFQKHSSQAHGMVLLQPYPTSLLSGSGRRKIANHTKSVSQSIPNAITPPLSLGSVLHCVACLNQRSE